MVIRQEREPPHRNRNPQPIFIMLKPHQELLATLNRAHELAVAIEREGGAVMGIIHHVRSASELTTLRVENYKQGNAAAAEAAAAAEVEAKAKADAEAKAKADAEAAAQTTGAAPGTAKK